MRLPLVTYTKFNVIQQGLLVARWLLILAVYHLVVLLLLGQAMSRLQQQEIQPTLVR
jgi:hypothetical protein